MSILTKCTRPLCAAERSSTPGLSSSEGRLVSSQHRLECWRDRDQLTQLQEAQTGVIDLPEDKPAIVKLLMQFSYEGEYKLELSGAQTDSSTQPRRPTHNHEGLQYHYKFPDTCRAISGGFSARSDLRNQPVVCPHHNCNESNMFSGTCQHFTCEQHCQPYVLRYGRG